LRRSYLPCQYAWTMFGSSGVGGAWKTE
jgi:hypothetical protein